MINRRAAIASIFGALAAASTGVAHAVNKDASVSNAVRNALWAVPLQVKGAANLYQISPQLYRCEQPTKEGIKNLEILGIRTVINLRAFHSDDDLIRGTLLRARHTGIQTWNVGDTPVIEVLSMLRRSDDGPFLIHCLHGADRTGLICAMYRIIEQRWDKEDAIRELVEGGYGFHSMWRNIPAYIRRANTESLRLAIDARSSRSEKMAP